MKTNNTENVYFHAKVKKLYSKVLILQYCKIEVRDILNILHLSQVIFMSMF